MDKLRWALTTGLGRVGHALRYNRVEKVCREGERYYVRRRRWFAPPLLPLINGLLKIEGSWSRVLSTGDWIARERRLYRLLYGIELADRGREAATPELPGCAVADLLAAGGAIAEKALSAAAAALSEFHELGLTHGDATLENVLYDAATNRARWIDFDTAHRPGAPRLDAEADDWRALLASAACEVPAERLAGACAAVPAAVAAAVSDRLERQSRRPTPFQAAQAATAPERLGAVAAALRRRMGAGSSRP